MTRSEATEKVLTRREGSSLIANYYGAAASLDEGPQGFLADLLEKDAYVAPHFHDVDQFQVFVAGEGTFGPHAIRPLYVHFADAYTPYGPIHGGVSFFTLRAMAAGGVYQMPESRHLLTGERGRNLSGYFDLGRGSPGEGKSKQETIISGADGLSAIGFRLGPNARLVHSDTAANARYSLVCSGSLMDQGREAPPLSLTFAEALDNQIDMTAGPSGAEVLLMQFPKIAARRHRQGGPGGAYEAVGNALTLSSRA